MTGASAAILSHEVTSGTEATHVRTIIWKGLGCLTFIRLPATVPLYRTEKQIFILFKPLQKKNIPTLCRVAYWIHSCNDNLALFLSLDHESPLHIPSAQHTVSAQLCVWRMEDTGPSLSQIKNCDLVPGGPHWGAYWSLPTWEDHPTRSGWAWGTSHLALCPPPQTHALSRFTRFTK